MQKEAAQLLRKLQRVKNLSPTERVLFARSLAATPDQRWQMHQNFLRSLGLFTHSSRKGFSFKS